MLKKWKFIEMKKVKTFQAVMDKFLGLQMLWICILMRMKYSSLIIIWKELLGNPLFLCICMENSCILHFFKLKYVPGISFLKYFEYITQMDWNHQIWGSPCIKIWYHILQWRPYWI